MKIESARNAPSSVESGSLPGIAYGEGEQSAEFGRRTVRKAAWKILPLIILCYFVSYLDRTNVGIAALQMNKDLGMTASMFGFGAGVFFLLYFSLEVPSNLLMVRFGVSRWIARIMFTWGLLAGATAFVKGPTSFYIMRALLGAAEAGFYPAIVFFLSQWFPSEYRARMLSYLNIAGPLTFLTGAPLSAALLNIEGLGLRGWQWMFILEALPAVVLAGVVFKYLPNRPGLAKWLTKEESSWLTQTLASEEAAAAAHVRDYTVAKAILSPAVLALSFFMFNIALTVYTVGFFLPQIVSGFGLDNLRTGIMSAVPFIAGSVGMLFVGWRSDRARERYFHAAGPMLLAAGALACAGLTADLTLKVVSFSVVAFGAYGCAPVFWSLPSTFMSGKALAGGVAVINSIGALGGFAGLWLMGFLKDTTGSFSGGLFVMAAMNVCAVAVMLVLRMRMRHATRIE